MTNEEKLLIESWMLIDELIGSEGKRVSNFKSIRCLVYSLYHNFNICRDEIKSHLKYTFRKRDRHIKYDPCKSSPETYVVSFVYYELLNLIAFYRKEFIQRKSIPLSELDNGEQISGRIGCSLTPYERRGIDALINETSPEDELLKKELAQIAIEFFGPDDVAVLLGARDRKKEAERLGIDYFTYSKRLERKVQRFKSHLQDIDYPV